MINYIPKESRVFDEQNLSCMDPARETRKLDSYF